jgi:hypothetical protein
VEPDRTEIALDHDQVPAAFDPVQVEELEPLTKPFGEFVLLLTVRQVGIRACPAAGVGHELALGVLDRDAHPASHRALGAEAQAEELDELGLDIAFSQVRVIRLEGEAEAERLVGCHRFGSVSGGLPVPFRACRRPVSATRW